MADFNIYQDPGVSIQELETPILSAISIAPTVIGIVGDSQRFRSNRETRQLFGTTPIELARLGVNEASVVVTDRFTGQVYNLTTDYTVASVAGEDTLSDTADDVTSITRVDTGDIPDGAQLNITYNFTDPNYFKVNIYSDYDDVRDRFGAPFDTTGSVNSEVSLAAFLAFLNGAGQVAVSPIDAAASTPTTEEWSNAISALSDVPQVNVVVPVSSDASVQALVQTHVQTQSNLGKLRRAFFGRFNVSVDVLKSAAAGYSDSRISLVGPSKVDFFEGNSGQTIQLGGEYVAAAVAGALAKFGPGVPLTRKTIRGFSISRQESENIVEEAQQSGLLYLYQRRSGEVVVRHGLTTNMSNIYSRELSIQTAKDRLVTLVQDSIDTENLIGSIITEDTPQLVASTVINALDTARSAQLIFDFSNVKFRQPASNPTTIQVRFQYKPTLPLNYIDVAFGIDTDTGSIEFIEVA